MVTWREAVFPLSPSPPLLPDTLDSCDWVPWTVMWVGAGLSNFPVCQFLNGSFTLSPTSGQIGVPTSNLHCGIVILPSTVGTSTVRGSSPCLRPLAGPVSSGGLDPCWGWRTGKISCFGLGYSKIPFRTSIPRHWIVCLAPSSMEQICGADFCYIEVGSYYEVGFEHKFYFDIMSRL